MDPAPPVRPQVVRGRNALVGAALVAFVGGVYAYTMRAVGGSDDIGDAVRRLEKEQATNATNIRWPVHPHKAGDWLRAVRRAARRPRCAAVAIRRRHVRHAVMRADSKGAPLLVACCALVAPPAATPRCDRSTAGMQGRMCGGNVSAVSVA
ncbi:unnamed protein product [Closterium sp. Naga37s-1]|nr:unnamed protein product [Closterium sp. Naga37s-1]